VIRSDCSLLWWVVALLVKAAYAQDAAPPAQAAGDRTALLKSLSLEDLSKLQ